MGHSMTRAPVLLVSCTRCQRLHSPQRDDAANPLCRRCTLPRRQAARRSRTQASRR
jgi:hypothetical protein